MPWPAVCALLETESGSFALACSALELVETGETEVVPLAECMRSEQSPVEGVARLGEGIACAVCAERLARLIGARRVTHEPQRAEMLAGA